EEKLTPLSEIAASAVPKPAASTAGVAPAAAPGLGTSTFGGSTTGARSSLFGNTGTPAGGSSLFGASTTGTTGGSLFGNPTNAGTTSAFGGFGTTSTNTSTAPGTSLFGAPSATTPGTFGFGTPAASSGPLSAPLLSTSTGSNGKKSSSAKKPPSLTIK
ncbi:hypothetical protein HK102_007168, partial [Quaeritorhiza haematococci]